MNHSYKMEPHISMLEEFARSQPKVNAIYQGHNPEEKDHRIYYILVSQRYDEALADAITELDIKIANETEERCTLLEWPCPVEEADNSPFIEECIWRRN